MKSTIHPSSPARSFSRRGMIKTAALAVCGVAFPKAFWTACARAAENSKPAILAPLNSFPRMVQEYLLDRVRRRVAESHQTKAALRSRQEAEAYVRLVREKILASLGPFPGKTPLNPRITGELNRDQYRIEKIIFESRPGFLVTGNLYLPMGRNEPRPAVLGLCGHSDSGKAYEAYQAFAQGLARQGYVVLIIDPIGQGERLQYPVAGGKSKIGIGVREHLYAGNQQLLVGEFFGSWRAWDGIRAVDYLLTRPEVDGRHLGVTGNSGGGTMSAWLCGLEPRFTMAAPSCFVTSFLRNAENELPADIEQCPPRALALGLDHEDFIAAMAPKPVLLISQERDFFDVRGTEEAYQRLKHLYRLLGAEDQIALFTGPQPHGFSREGREAMYGWFNRVTGISTAPTEPELVIEKQEILRCAPQGQVAELLSRTVFSFTRDRSRQLAEQRPQLDLAGLQSTITTLLRLPPRQGAPEYRILRPRTGRRYPLPHATRYAVATEPGIQALVCRLSRDRHDARPPLGPPRAVLYVAHHSSDAELRDEPLLRQLLSEEPDSPFYTCDVRGVGESRPDTCDQDSFLSVYGSDYFYAAHGLMLDYPYLGQKTYDVLCVLDWLKSRGSHRVHLVAKGWGALPATFAALLSDEVERVTLKNALTSYASIAESESYQWPLSALPPFVLQFFDLPDCYRQLEAKGLRQIDPWGGAGPSA